jgi:hypothetical protein
MNFEPVVTKTVDFLTAAQHQGSWQDYNLPVGISTEWATGYIGWALAEAAQQWQQPKAMSAANEAASWLSDKRSYAQGWGYNSNTGPDSDSTACAIALLDAVEYPVAESDRAFLRQAWRENEGFITFVDGEGAWAEPHLDILWPALKGAQLTSVKQRWLGLQDKLSKNFSPQTGWRGYWWQGPWYCTYHLLLAAHWLGIKHDFIFTPVAGPLTVQSFSSAGWIAGSLMLSGHSSAGLELFKQIVNQQNPDGSWNASADLRVTDPDVADPDDTPLSGKCYADQHRLMTTASILRALCTASIQTELDNSQLNSNTNQTIQKELANNE